MIPVTVMPIVFDMLADVPDDVEPLASPLVAGVTLVVMLAIAFGSRSTLRLWGPIIGIVVGCGIALWFGLYDTARVAAAGWIGIPDGGWPGFDLDFGPTFWILLPAFIFVTYVGAIETIGDSVAIQSVSWKRRRAIDYKVVQGAVSADGVGNFLSGLAGTIPNTTYSTSIAVVELTGIASRRVGVCVGLVLVIVAFVPKFAALVLAIPAAVAAAYLVVLLGLLFVAGMRLVIGDGMDYRKSLMVGTAFWIGTGFQHGVLFPDLLGPWVGSLVGNGMTAGGITAVVLTVCLNLMSPRSAVLKTRQGADAPQEVSDFLKRVGSTHGWTETQTDRLILVGDEMAATLTAADDDGEGRRLVVKARGEGSSIELEFVTSGSDGNIEDEIMLLGEQPDRTMVERELSLRLLRHYASSVHHQSFTNADVLTARVERPEQGTSESRPSIE
ncbi:MAG: SulP family inorganic anion transporter, partial [Gammaproteobacteria bacterium]|nr:SulP family inorganic anion transporter [Gammaproteobacteria bacterium]